jgi:hypothetical protein
MQKDLNTKQQRWLEVLKDYDNKVFYHPGKANVVANALSQKSREVEIDPSSVINQLTQQFAIVRMMKC